MSTDVTNDYSYGLIPFYLENSDPRYFLGLRTGDIFWKFPKGHREERETVLDAALRETAEEIGIRIELDHVLTTKAFTESYTYMSESGSVEKINTYWLAEVEPGTKVNLNKEFSEYRWVSIDEALDLLPENSQGLLTEAHEYLTSHS